jgi:hypothetical protein
VGTFRTSVIAMRVAAVTIVALALASSSSAATVVRTWFPQGDQLRYGVRAVDGSAPVLQTTVKALLAGPTPSEARDGARTAFARGTRLLGLHRQGSLVTIQLDRRFLQQTAADARPAMPARFRLRILQLGRTLSQFPGIRRFRLSVSGRLLAQYPDLGLRWHPDDKGTWELGELVPIVAFPLSMRIVPGDVEDPAPVSYTI